MEDTSDAGIQKRSSGRSVKRRRFTDDITEAGPSGSTLGTKATKQKSVLGGKAGSSKSNLSTLIQQTRKQTARVCRRSRKVNSKQSHLAATRDLGRWKPADDLALVTAVLQTNDLVAVHRGVKFSCHFTLDEVTDRWYALMYDKIVSKTATSAMRNLHPETVAAIQARTLFSKEEEETLSAIPSETKVTVQSFDDLLREKPTTFHVGRTGKALLAHWQLMKQYHLLSDQTIQPLPKGDHIMQFHEAESLLRDSELVDTTNDFLENELVAGDRSSKRSIRRLEAESRTLQVISENAVGSEQPQFDPQTLAVLNGRLVKYRIRSKEVTLGRSTPEANVDIDLSLEGPSWKISRRQGSIKLTSLGKFILINEGKRPIYVDGKVLLTGAKTKLVHNSVIEIAGLSLTFTVNQEIVNSLKTETKQSPAAATASNSSASPGTLNAAG